MTSFKDSMADPLGAADPDMDVGEDRDIEIIGGGDSSPYSGPPPVWPTASRRVHRPTKGNECVTQIEPVTLTQKWTIANFTSLLKLSHPGCCLRSTVFRDASHPDACWQLCLYPGGKREENANHVSLFLKMSATLPNKEVFVKAEYRFFFLDENDEARFTNVNIGDFHAKPPKGGHSWGLRNIPRSKVSNSIRSDNSLVISCAIELIPDMARVPCKKINPTMGPSTEMAFVTRTHVMNELRMKSSGENSDLIIRGGFGTEKRTFHVHRYKLISQSDVFRVMLQYEDMQESKSGEIVIDDFSYIAVDTMLEFIYSGSISADIPVHIYSETMELADKYNVSSLKSLCEDQLIEKVSYKNALDVLVLADRFQAKCLIEHCFDVMVTHKNKVLESAEWDEFKKRNGDLTAQILETMLASDNNTPPVKRSRV